MIGETIKKVRANSNPGLEIEGLLRTMYDFGTCCAQQVSDQLQAALRRQVHRTVVPEISALLKLQAMVFPCWFRPSVERCAGVPCAGAKCLAKAFRKTQMVKLNGLGRGLDALLSGDKERADDRPPTDLAVGLLKPGRFQPRTRMDPQSIAELADSIKAQGLIQPILVRPVDNGKYEIIAGERRWRASQLAGLTQVPVVIREVPDKAALAMALIENIQREDLNPLEEATGIQRLVDEFEHDARNCGSGSGSFPQRSHQSAAPAQFVESGTRPVDAGKNRDGTCSCSSCSQRVAPGRTGSSDHQPQSVGARGRATRRSG